MSRASEDFLKIINNHIIMLKQLIIKSITGGILVSLLAFPASRLLLALIAGGVAYAASDQTDTESGVPKTWVSARAMKVRPMSGLTKKP